MGLAHGLGDASDIQHGPQTQTRDLAHDPNTRGEIHHHNKFYQLQITHVPRLLTGNYERVPNRNCSGGFVPGTLRGDRAEGDVVMTIPDPVPAGVGAKVERLHLDITHRERGNDVEESHVWISAAGLPKPFDCDLTDPDTSLGTADNFQTDGYDCKLSGFELPYFPVGDLTVTYQVQLKNRREGDPERTADVALDAVQLTAVFAAPRHAHPSRAATSSSMVAEQSTRWAPCTSRTTA